MLPRTIVSPGRGCGCDGPLVLPSTFILNDVWVCVDRTIVQPETRQDGLLTYRNSSSSYKQLRSRRSGVLPLTKSGHVGNRCVFSQWSHVVCYRSATVCTIRTKMENVNGKSHHASLHYRPRGVGGHAGEFRVSVKRKSWWSQNAGHRTCHRGSVWGMGLILNL